MSLIEEMTEEFTILTKTYVDDGLGGFVPSYVDGITITGALGYTNSLPTRVAQAQGVQATYSFYTSEIELEYHDVLKRVKDGKIFRVTKDGKDEIAPKSASPEIAKMRRVSCEEWTLPEV